MDIIMIEFLKELKAKYIICDINHPDSSFSLVQDFQPPKGG